MSVKVAKYRNETDHLFRLANVDYHACVGVREVERWKETAAHVLAHAEGLTCSRASAYDRERFTKAIAAVKAQLIAADARIAQLQTKTVLTPTQQTATETIKQRKARLEIAKYLKELIDDEFFAADELPNYEWLVETLREAGV